MSEEESPELDWQQWADNLHQAILGTIEALIERNPPAGSPEAQLLSNLAGAAELYEKERHKL